MLGITHTIWVGVFTPRHCWRSVAQHYIHFMCSLFFKTKTLRLVMSTPTELVFWVNARHGLSEIYTFHCSRLTFTVWFCLTTCQYGESVTTHSLIMGLQLVIEYWVSILIFTVWVKQISVPAIYRFQEPLIGKTFEVSCGAHWKRGVLETV